MATQPLKSVVLESAPDVLLLRTKEAEELYFICGQLTEISGIDKLRRKLKAELNFLRKLSLQAPNLNINQLKSSNLPHLSAIVECISQLEGVVKLLMPFTYSEESYPPKRIVIDVVADYGQTWVKVVARNPDALLQVSRGAGKYGRKSLAEQIKELKDCAAQNEYLFSPPKIQVCFTGKVDDELVKPLKEMDVRVLYLRGSQCLLETNVSNRIAETKSKHGVSPDSNRECSVVEMSSTVGDQTSSQVPADSRSIVQVTKSRNLDPCSDLSLPAITEDATLNLDVSCMIAYISNLTNGFCNVKLKDKILTEQGQQEAISPVRCYLDKLFQGRKLVCCNSAYTRFVSIFTVIGGQQERKRATDLVSRLVIVDDNPSSRCMQLQEIGKINKKSKVIFGTGDTLKAITVTANVGFVRAAKCQGEKFVAFLHESRALSEMKELPNV